MKFKGIVKKHLGRGKKLGFPTANIDAPQEIKDGLYVGLTHFHTVAYDSEPRASLIFIGANQTFGEADRRAEVYILDFNEDLYDQEIEVELVKRLRGVIKFDSAKELIAQMQEDEKEAREYFMLQNVLPPPGEGGRPVRRSLNEGGRPDEGGL